MNLLVVPNFNDAFDTFPLKDASEFMDFKRYFEIVIKRDLFTILLQNKLAHGDRIFLEHNSKFIAFLAHCMEIDITESLDILIQNIELVYTTIPSYVCWGLIDLTMKFWHCLTPNLRARLMILALECHQIELFNTMVSREEPCNDLLVINSKADFQVDLTPLLTRGRMSSEISEESFDSLSSEVQFQIIQTTPTSTNLKHLARQIYTDYELTPNLITFFVRKKNHDYLNIFLEHLRQYYYHRFQDQLRIRDKYSNWMDKLLSNANPQTSEFIRQNIHRDEYKVDHGHTKYYKQIWRPNISR